jgi:hypothetical protein
MKESKFSKLREQQREIMGIKTPQEIKESWRKASIECSKKGISLKPRKAKSQNTHKGPVNRAKKWYSK